MEGNYIIVEEWINKINDKLESIVTVDTLINRLRLLVFKLNNNEIHLRKVLSGNYAEMILIINVSQLKCMKPVVRITYVVDNMYIEKIEIKDLDDVLSFIDDYYKRWLNKW